MAAALLHTASNATAGPTMVASCAAECTATGDGLQQATPREEARFTIIARDAAGQPRRVGGELFKVLFRGASSPAVQQRDVGDGTYACSYLVSYTCYGYTCYSYTCYGYTYYDRSALTRYSLWLHLP